MVSVSHWDEMGTWEGAGLRREVFFFPSAGAEIYGSIYAPASPAPASPGVVLCNSWGYEASVGGRTMHQLSLATAQAGGVALNFHCPGFGDSQGDPQTTTMEEMSLAAADAAGEASRRYPGRRWILAGLRLGASVAALAAARRPDVEHLLLIQPALRPGHYFDRLERASKRALGSGAPPPAPGFAYGYPLAPAMLESATPADAAVAAALAGFEGRGAVVKHEAPATPDEAPERFERVIAPGPWRFAAKDDPSLVESAATWIGRHVQGAE